MIKNTRSVRLNKSLFIIPNFTADTGHNTINDVSKYFNSWTDWLCRLIIKKLNANALQNNWGSNSVHFPHNQYIS